MKSPGAIAFKIFGLPILWYGVLISIAMILAVLLIMRRAGSFKINKDKILDLTVAIIPISIIGARLYYVLFNLKYYHSFGEIISIRNGGLAIHGGLIAGLLVILVYCKITKINTWDVLDLVVAPVALAQAIGRWGNFFNNEAFGSPTRLPWAVNIGGDTYHPTFLYESIWCILIFLFLSYILKKPKFKGQFVLLYCILYSFERFFVEWLRIDSLMIGPFKQAQVLSLIVFILSIILYIKKSKRPNQTITTESTIAKEER